MARPRQVDFSVIIPVYNGIETLERAIASVLAQDHAHYEIVAVDDGSTDDSWELLQKLAKKEPRLRLAQLSNSGQPAVPRNHGISLAQGTYVAFLDQDDTWRPNKLMTQLKKFQSGDFVVVYSDALVHDNRLSEGDFLYSSHMKAMPDGDVVGQLLEENFIPMLTAAVRRDWLQRVGPINTKIPGVDDYELWLRLAFEGARFGYVNETLADYNLSNSNLSHQQEMMMTSLVHTYGGLIGRYPSFTKQLRPRLKEARYHLCGFYIGRLKHQKGPWSARIKTAREAFASSVTVGQWIRIALRLILPPS